jgi:hypothetical protein
LFFARWICFLLDEAGYRDKGDGKAAVSCIQGGGESRWVWKVVELGDCQVRRSLSWYNWLEDIGENEGIQVRINLFPCCW